MQRYNTASTSVHVNAKLHSDTFRKHIHTYVNTPFTVIYNLKIPPASCHKEDFHFTLKLLPHYLVFMFYIYNS